MPGITGGLLGGGGGAATGAFAGSTLSLFNDAKSGGLLKGGIFGGNDSATPQVQANLGDFNKDLGKIRDRRDTDPELRKSTGMLTDIQGRDFANLRDQSAVRNQASLDSALQQGAISGGLDAGSVERLARQNLRQSRLGNQEIGLAETQEKARTEFGDIAQQEQFRDQLLTQVPQLELGRAGVISETQRTNAALRLQADAAKKGQMGALGGLLGAGAGLALGGGPMGAMAGSSIGSGIFGLG